MNRKYVIDGRDPEAKGYVKEDRMANQAETDKIVEALESFGYKDAEDYKFHLFGRLDDVYGWYLFGISKEDECGEDYLILGDCLDVLDAPYDRVIGLDEVIHFANTCGTAVNVGTAYAAMEDWGVFHSLSSGLYDVLADVGVSVENERAVKDKDGNWMLVWDVCFTTDMGGNERVEISVLAQYPTEDEADHAFMLAWKDECAAYKVGERYEDFMDDDEVTADEAMQWAESKEREMYKIRRAISNYLDEGITPDEDDALAKSRERVTREKVWVLTIYKDSQFFPEVHKTFEGAVDGVLIDIQEHMDDPDEYDHEAIVSALKEQHYWADENTDAEYDIAECVVCK